MNSLNILSLVMGPAVIAAAIAAIVTYGLAIKKINEDIKANKLEAKRKAYESFLKVMPVYLKGWGDEHAEQLKKLYHTDGKALLYMYGSKEVIRLVTALETESNATKQLGRYEDIILQCRREVGEATLSRLELNVTQPDN